MMMVQDLISRGRFWEDDVLVNCAFCDRVIIVKSNDSYFRYYAGKPFRFKGRPCCNNCRNYIVKYNHPPAAIHRPNFGGFLGSGERRCRIVEDDNPWQSYAVKCLEDSLSTVDFEPYDAFSSKGCA